MCCKTRLGKKRLRGEGHDGGVGWAVCCECLSVGFEAPSRRQQGQPKETTGEYHMHNPSQVGAVGLGVMGDGPHRFFRLVLYNPPTARGGDGMKLEGTG